MNLNLPAIRLGSRGARVAKILDSVWARDGALKTIEFWFAFEPV